MPHLNYIPDVSGYSATLGTGVIATDVPGGFPRLRQDQIISPDTFTVTWKFNAAEYSDFMFFIRNDIAGGAFGFTINLILASGGATAYSAQFVPGTLKLTDATGDNRTVTAEIIALPNETLDVDDFIELFGSPSIASAFLLSLEELVNVTMPEKIGA